MIDGWISLVNRHERFNGVELIENLLPEGKTNLSKTNLDSVTAKFYLKGMENPVVVTEYMDECFNVSKEPWKQWPRRMLRHKAYIQGARLAFGFSGIYDEDEKDRILNAQAADVIDAPMVGLKHDKNAKAPVKEAEVITPAAATEEKISADDEFYGDPARFGEKADEAKKYIDQIKEFRAKLGNERFAKILEAQGVGTISDVNDIAKLVVIGAELLSATKEAEVS